MNPEADIFLSRGRLNIGSPRCMRKSDFECRFNRGADITNRTKERNYAAFWGWFEELVVSEVPKIEWNRMALNK